MSFISSLIKNPVANLDPFHLVEGAGQAVIGNILPGKPLPVPPPNQGEGSNQAITALTSVLQQVVTALTSVLSSLVQMIAGKGSNATESKPSNGGFDFGNIFKKLTEGVFGAFGSKDEKKGGGFGETIKDIGKKALPFLVGLF